MNGTLWDPCGILGIWAADEAAPATPEFEGSLGAVGRGRRVVVFLVELVVDLAAGFDFPGVGPPFKEGIVDEAGSGMAGLRFEFCIIIASIGFGNSIEAGFIPSPAEAPLDMEAIICICNCRNCIIIGVPDMRAGFIIAGFI